MEQFPEIIEAARQGQADAIHVLIQRYQYIVESECSRRRGLLGTDVSQADVQQEVWLRVWSQIHRFEGAEQESDCERMFRAWLRSTARHVVMNQITRGKARKRAPRNGTNVEGVVDNLMDAQSTASRIASRNEDKVRISHAIEEIEDPALRQIIKARFFEGKSIADIAKQLGLTYEQTRYRFNRALDQMKDLL